MIQSIAASTSSTTTAACPVSPPSVYTPVRTRTPRHGGESAPAPSHPSPSAPWAATHSATDRGAASAPVVLPGSFEAAIHSSVVVSPLSAFWLAAPAALAAFILMQPAISESMLSPTM
eukprot:CAMPEP_0119509188 /NCGR_PEP_ID=MMETSP1344-20130328/28559_1 /TAXON_ID=236787 /ORGANISM="Florenciella parvula, Strain CCMP2471" /LENGTH=117 /DNA_ID=CAMNT_0007545999 /DNA_START=244 /DNA_END=597 /DNA_ORIENTATION=-